jgi:hypothetical protein
MGAVKKELDVFKKNSFGHAAALDLTNRCARILYATPSHQIIQGRIQ